MPKTDEATEAKVKLHRRDDNVSFIADGDFGPVRVITRPSDDVFEGHPGYVKRVVGLFADYGVTVSDDDVAAALKA